MSHARPDDRLVAMQAPYAGLPAQAQQPPAAAPPRKYDGKNGMPLYDTQHGGHYGASAHIAAQGHAPPPETFTGQWGNVSTREMMPWTLR